MLVVVVGLPSLQRSIRLQGIGSMNGGGYAWLDLCLCVCLASGVCMSSFWGRSIVRVLFSPYFGVSVVMRVLISV